MDHPPPSEATAFVGRERELLALQSLIADARAGKGRLALVTGEAGIGKTRLATELALLAHQQGVRVCWGRCHEGVGAPAFWPWVQILRAQTRGRASEPLMPEPQAGASDLAPLAAELHRALPEFSLPATLPPDEARFRLFDALSSFLQQEATRQPLLLILDDLHWADAPSLLLLAFLARVAPHACLVVVAVYRDTEVDQDHPLAQTRASLAREQVSVRLALQGLSRVETTRLLGLVSGMELPADLATAVMEKTEGNPFFVLETVRLLAAEGRLSRQKPAPPMIPLPPTVREVVGQRLSRLSEPCRRLLTVAAIIGREFGATVLERASAQSRLEVLDQLEEAEAGGIIVAVADAPGRFRFAHALIRETLYEALPTTRRARWHVQVGEAVEGLAATSTAARVAELAHHFYEGMAAGSAARAFTYACWAAEQATGMLAYEEAVTHYRHALQALDLYETAEDHQRCELLLALGEAQVRAGERPAADASFRHAAGIARGLHAPELFARAALGIEGTGAFAAYSIDPALVGLLEEALGRLGEGDSIPRARVLSRLAMELSFAEAAADQQRRAPLIREALAMSARLDDPSVRAAVLADSYFVLWSPDNLDERMDIARESVRLAEERRSHELALWGHGLELINLLERGDIQAVDAKREVIARLSEMVPQPLHHQKRTMITAMRALLDGRLDEAEPLMLEAFQIGQQAHSPDALMYFGVQLWALRREQGRLSEVETPLRALVEQYPGIPGWRCALALLYCELGRPADARRELEHLAGDAFAAVPREGNWLMSLTLLAEVCAVLGDIRHAGTLYELLLPYARRNAVAAFLAACNGSVAYYLGLLATVLGRWEAAHRHFEDALAAHERMGARPFVARTRFALAAMLHARGAGGDHDRALTLLKQSHETAGALEMTRLEAQVTTLMQQLGAGRKDRGVRYPNRLTAREVEVLRLIASGHTNQEIAAGLRITVPTVERHIANLYGKIDARGRADATAYFYQHLPDLARAP